MPPWVGSHVGEIHMPCPPHEFVELFVKSHIQNSLLTVQLDISPRILSLPQYPPNLPD
ncbi:hypothetical protein KM92DES2_10668 [uncultured Desulfovibrio sp.]|uniref:Uncharacterized protein n=1 Tax=uncultured Desulfovibrio sp. TaxID=167968 RepID=A0A212J7Q8_9BACT|nr:hypothetical protein KM92DES2_10668 [uncultured Desulfovibrio sp.]